MEFDGLPVVLKEQVFLKWGEYMLLSPCVIRVRCSWFLLKRFNDSDRYVNRVVG